MYCLHCQKEYGTGMFCPICNRMLVSEHTFDYQNNESYKRDYMHEELIAEKQRIKQEQEKIVQNERSHNIPKCPVCQSPNIEKIGTLERAASVTMLGIFSKKINKSFKCKNCGYTF